MKEIVVLSGKGGSGKTSVTAALTRLVERGVLADCDVDAANLHLTMNARELERHPFYAGYEAFVERQLCTGCGRCEGVCRFGAIVSGGEVDELSCEGCGACALVCPQQAIDMRQRQAGHWLVSQTPYGTLVHAELGAAVDNSGKLVSQVRREARRRGEEQKGQWLLVDGPPGVGCPTIASLSGVDAVLLVLEPTGSGLQDARRLVALARHFSLPVLVCINKATLHLGQTEAARAWARQEGLTVVGELPYHEAFRQASAAGSSIWETGGQELRRPLQALWQRLQQVLGANNTAKIDEKN